ncbi:unnamed protein product, partial [Tetraodon nigroviridis]
MPSTKMSKQWTLSEVLGQRRVLGVGILLAWLLLFHLLVNVWLLCIFTSLLVALGGWLGSRAVLDANSLLHLEHFLPLGKVSPPLCSPEHEWRLNHEIHNAVHKAVRDFVSSWYRTLLPEAEGEFECAVRGSMLESVMELKERARRVDRKALVQQLLQLYGCHLQSYMTARQIQSTERSFSLWKLYSEVDAPHPAVKSPSEELRYSRALVNLFLHVLVPYPQMETRTGGYMVTELITCNVLVPLIQRVSDPDWLNQTILDIITRSREPREVSVNDPPGDPLYMRQNQRESWTTCRSQSSLPDGISSESTADLDDVQSWSSGCSGDSSQCSLMAAGKPEHCKVNCCSASSHLLRSKMVLLDSLIPSDSSDGLTGGLCDCGPSANFCNLNLNDEENFGCFGPLKNLGPKAVAPMDPQCAAGVVSEKFTTSPSRKPCVTANNFDASAHQASPVRIQNVHVSGAVTAMEQRGSSTHPYTLYVITFEMVAEAENGGPVQRVCYHTVDRRYSEFLNLQTRLEEKPEVKKLIKNVKGPKKMFPDLMFGNADNDKVEARKTQLDTFLQQLSSIPEMSNSEDMQEFLALNSDATRYFGRKPFAKSRIDKMMENAFDTLKTAFPNPDLFSPLEELETDGRTADSRKYRRSIFPSKISPALNIPDLHPKVVYCFSEGCTVLSSMTVSDLERFVEQQERRLCEPNGKKAARQSCDQSSKEKKEAGKTQGTDTAVADVALNILCLLMKDQWSWLCTENIQKTIRLLFGTFIERWLEVGVAHLTSAPCWVIYLQVLQEAVWPGGALPVQPRPERSAAQRQEAKEQCLDCLMQLLPEIVTDMLGSEKFRLSIETMLESLQDPQINKHLIFCICDLLLEFL